VANLRRSDRKLAFDFLRQGPLSLPVLQPDEQ
jgi:hypothetical protein